MTRNSAHPDKKLVRLRKRIDGLDVQIVRLLNQRTELAVAIGRIKREKGLPVLTPAREREVIARVAANSQGPLRAKELRAIYREVMAAALSFEGGLTLGILKSDGVSAWAAARSRFGEGSVLRSFSSLPALRRAKGIQFVLLSEKVWRSEKKATGIWSVCETVRVGGLPGAFVLLAAGNSA